MSWQVVNLPALIPTTTGAGAVTNFIGNLDDADSLTIYMVSTANAGSSGATGLTIQVTQWDPATTPTPPTGVTQSTAINTLSTSVFSTGATGSTILMTSSGNILNIMPVNFRGLRLSGVTSGISGQAIAFASKTIWV